MKVFIGPFVNWTGPYQIAEKILFWKDPYEDKSIHKFGDFLAGRDDNSVIYRLCNWVHSKKKRTVKIKIDKFDTWNADETLALIVLPLLKELKKVKNSSCPVEMEDVPEHLRYTETDDYDAQSTFDFYSQCEGPKIDCDVHSRWDWVLNEMIWTFEQLQPDYDWESQYTIVSPEIDFSDYPEDEEKTRKPLRWDVEGKFDFDGLNAHRERINNGLRLFGKYYGGLWW